MQLLNGRVFSGLSARSRRQKVALLREHLVVAPRSRVLDLGAQVDPAQAQLLEPLPDKRSVVAVNLQHGHLARIRTALPEVRLVVADARRLPFADGSFHVVYSNAVIEHVGDFDAQAEMAAEVSRVGRNWFVTTPNRWFPFEFHLRLPFVSWLPTRWLLWVARHVAWDHQARRYRSGIRQRLRLLSGREMKRLFPGSRILWVRITFWPETIVAAGGSDLRDA